jgi:hypothetical protein
VPSKLLYLAAGATFLSVLPLFASALDYPMRPVLVRGRHKKVEHQPEALSHLLEERSIDTVCDGNDGLTTMTNASHPKCLSISKIRRLRTLSEHGPVAVRAGRPHVRLRLITANVLNHQMFQNP